MSESDIVVEDEVGYNPLKEKAVDNDVFKCGMISNNYFNYQPVTLNQIEEAEESKTNMRPGAFVT